MATPDFISIDSSRHTATVNCLVADYYGQKLASCSNDNTVLIYEKKLRYTDLEGSEVDANEKEESRSQSNIQSNNAHTHGQKAHAHEHANRQYAQYQHDQKEPEKTTMNKNEQKLETQVTKTWVENESMRIYHTSPVWSASWSHPECGTFLALAGYDCKVTVYKWSNKTWQKKNEVADSTEPVTCIEFAPQEYVDRWKEGKDQFKSQFDNLEIPLGLYLAVASLDGQIRFYRFASVDSTGEMVCHQGQYTEDDVDNGTLIRVCLEHDPTTNSIRAISWSRSWNPKFEPLIAVGCGPRADFHAFDDAKDLCCLNRLKIYKQPKPKTRWELLEFPRNSPAFLEQPVNDVCFSSTAGRTYHLLAIASETGAKLLRLSYESCNVANVQTAGRNDRIDQDPDRKILVSEIFLDLKDTMTAQTDFYSNLNLGARRQLQMAQAQMDPQNHLEAAVGQQGLFQGNFAPGISGTGSIQQIPGYTGTPTHVNGATANGDVSVTPTAHVAGSDSINHGNHPITDNRERLEFTARTRNILNLTSGSNNPSFQSIETIAAKQVKFNMTGTMLTVGYDYGRVVVYQQSMDKNRWIVSSIM